MYLSVYFYPIECIIYFLKLFFSSQYIFQFFVHFFPKWINRWFFHSGSGLEKSCYLQP